MGAKKRVLAVDDEKLIVLAIRHNLEHAGYEVIEAFDGREALEKIEAHRPDLVVLDVMMPELNGWDVLSSIRDDPEVRDTPVIMLTALGHDADEREGVIRGADVYLTKPYEPQQLVELVNRLLAPEDF
jgi:two-component system alkaline phosphatase synthesis response regulator PhoP/two-component system response regulator VicR